MKIRESARMLNQSFRNVNIEKKTIKDLFMPFVDSCSGLDGYFRKEEYYWLKDCVKYVKQSISEEEWRKGMNLIAEERKQDFSVTPNPLYVAMAEAEAVIRAYEKRQEMLNNDYSDLPEKLRPVIPTMDVHEEVKRGLCRNLIKNNTTYREESGKNWYCITLGYLDLSVEETKESIEEIAMKSLLTVDNPQLRRVIKNKFSQAVGDQDKIMKTWFSRNYDDLLYKTDGTIPYPVVVRMRDKTSQWAIGNSNPFNQPIKEFIEEVARENGLNPDDYKSYEEIWKELKRI